MSSPVIAAEKPTLGEKRRVIQSMMDMLRNSAIVRRRWTDPAMKREWEVLWFVRRELRETRK